MKRRHIVHLPLSKGKCEKYQRASGTAQVLIPSSAYLFDKMMCWRGCSRAIDFLTR